MTNSVHNFHDINKLPKGYGVLVFPISIVRAENETGQTPSQCMEYVEHFSPSKVSEPKIGLNMVYGDFLYLHSSEPAANLKDRFMTIVLKHKNGFQKILAKKWQNLQIQHAFSYEVWNQLYLSYHGDFASDFARFKQLYEKDSSFQKYVAEDTDYVGRTLDEHQVNFFLEEHFMFYLLVKGKVSLPNEYIMGREEWILICYPGMPLKSDMYIYQLNPLKLDAPQNPYQNHRYDLANKVLVDFTKIDLEAYNYKYPSS